MTHGRWQRILLAAVAGGVFLASPAAAVADKKRSSGVKGSSDEVMRRLTELESRLGLYREEIQRLRAELAQKPRSVPGPGIVGAGGSATPSAQAKVTGGEWDEPELEKKPEGRDEEARRRLLVLETQARKATAEAAKQAQAQQDKVAFDFSGKYKAQFNSRRNFNLGNPGQQWTYDNASFIDHRFSLQVDASYEALLTRLVLDKGNFAIDWKEDSEGTLERWGQFQTASSEMVRELFVQYTGPFMVRAGRQNWDVGQRIVLEGPMDGIRFQYPFGQLPWGQTTLSAGYMAVAGGWNGYANFSASGGRLGGNRQAIFGASNKLDAYYADLDIRVSRGLQFKPYLLKVADRGGGGDSDLNLDKDFNATTLPRDGQFRPQWIGLSFSAEGAPWKLAGEVVTLSGDYAAGRKVAANAILMKAGWDIGKAASLGHLSAGMKFGRGSGNGTDNPASGTMRDFSALFMCRERDKFGNIFSEDLRAGYYFWDSNLANVSYLRLEATLDPGHGLKLTPSLSRLWTTREVFKGRGPVYDWSQGASALSETTRDIGWEADLNLSFPIYSRVEGFASFGYFKPGAAYAKPDGSIPKPAVEVVVGAEVKF